MSDSQAEFPIKLGTLDPFAGFKKEYKETMQYIRAILLCICGHKLSKHGDGYDCEENGCTCPLFRSS